MRPVFFFFFFFFFFVFFFCFFFLFFLNLLFKFIPGVKIVHFKDSTLKFKQNI